MPTYDVTIKDDAGVTVTEGTLTITGNLTANTINAVVVDPTPPEAGQILIATSATAAAWDDIPA